MRILSQALPLFTLVVVAGLGCSSSEGPSGTSDAGTPEAKANQVVLEVDGMV